MSIVALISHIFLSYLILIDTDIISQDISYRLIRNGVIQSLRECPCMLGNLLNIIPPCSRIWRIYVVEVTQHTRSYGMEVFTR